VLRLPILAKRGDDEQTRDKRDWADDACPVCISGALTPTPEQVRAAIARGIGRARTASWVRTTPEACRGDRATADQPAS
jgi:hypothetical protein